MKRIICAVCAVVVFLLLFSVSASAKTVSNSEYGIEAEFPDDYIVLTTGNLSKNADFVESIGHSTESLRKAMKNGNILFYAANESNTKQLHVKCWSTDFSERIGDLGSLSDESRAAAMESIQKILVEDGNQILFSSSFTYGGCLYLKIAVFVDADEPFCYIQYITVSSGRFYSLVYYNAHGYLTVAEQKEADSVLSGIKIDVKASGLSIDFQDVLYLVLMSVLIIGALVVIFLVIRSFYTDYVGSKDEPEIIPDRIKMKRNKSGGFKK